MYSCISRAPAAFVLDVEQAQRPGVHAVPSRDIDSRTTASNAPLLNGFAR